MNDIQSWIEVVTDPLGLAGFALFLVFGFLAKTRIGKNKQWIVISAFSMAFVALIGGLVLSWNKNTLSAGSAQHADTRETATTATTHGEKSPVVQNVEGDVVIKIEDGNRSK